MSTCDVILDRSYTGWLRLPGGRWQPVTSGPSAEMTRQRLDAAAAKHMHADLAVLPAAENPNQRRTR